MDKEEKTYFGSVEEEKNIVVSVAWGLNGHWFGIAIEQGA